MKIIKLKKEFSIFLDCLNTSYGFKHIAKLLKNYAELEKTKICYYNRTWERYEYQSVILDLISKSNHLTERQKKYYIKKYNNLDYI